MTVYDVRRSSSSAAVLAVPVLGAQHSVVVDSSGAFYNKPTSWAVSGVVV